MSNTDPSTRPLRRGTVRLLLMLTFLLLLASWAVVVHSQDSNGNGIADRLELPGTQPTTVFPGTAFDIDTAVLPANDCLTCHTTGTKAGPFEIWSGSMMANAARDPVFWAQLDVAEGDEASDPNLIGARDICLRCHMPKGWLEGRSSGPVLSDALRGMTMQEHDVFGVQCEVCHRMVDRDTSTADVRDQDILTGLGTNLDAELQVPPSYGNGMYILDRWDVRRGPFNSTQIGWPALLTPTNQFVVTTGAPDPSFSHPLKHSVFHRSGNLCGTCHDVSNPAWTPAQPKGNAQLNFPIERTWTEWTHSAYPALGENGNCQSCHMNGVLNGVIAGGASTFVVNPNQHLNDVHSHDFTGGNTLIPRVIAEMVNRFQATKSAPDPGPAPVIGGTQAERDAFLQANYARALKALYPPGAFGRPTMSEPPPLGFDEANYTGTSAQAKATLQRAAQLSATRVPGGDLKIRIWNMTGHKLPTGYPEGRRMWLDVRFINANPAGGESLEAQSGEFNAATGELYHDFDLSNTAGARAYDVATYTNGSGATLGTGRRAQVYEARMHHTPSGAEFHFIKNNERLSDNRIPPLGWVKTQYQANLAEQIIPTAYAGSQMVYHDNISGPVAMPPVNEPTYNFDEVPYPVPATSDVAEIRLQYQSVSKEYLEELVTANPRSLLYPAGGGVNAFSRADILEHAWRTFSIDGATRFPPVEMVRLRVALVDSDGDSLADDWETANGLDPSDATGDNGRNGDPDGDGRSNYLEFQAGTPANSADAVRGPVDLILVLDFSGSMNDAAPVSGIPKVEVLKDAVELFLKTWKQYAVRPDRIGVVYFSSTVALEGGGLIDLATLPAGTTIEMKIDELIAAVRARGAGGSTAVGGGLQRALNLLQGAAPGRRKQVILLTNGMQNYSPMIRSELGNYRIDAEPVSAADGVYGDSGVTDAGGPAFGTLLNTLGVRVHTIGIGVAETADDRWLNLIQGIALNTSGLPPNEAKSQFVSRASELEGAFLNGLVQSLRGFSPQILSEQSQRLESTEESRSLDFVLDQAATKATFVLSWAGAQIPGRLEFDLISPEGKTVLPLVREIDGNNFKIATAYLPLASSDGRPVGHSGSWKMIVRRAGRGRLPSTQFIKDGWKDAADFRAYLIADLPDFDFDARFGQWTYRAGDKVTLHLTVTEDSRPVTSLGKVTATITKPSVSFGDLISDRSIDSSALDRRMKLNDDPPIDLAEAKFRLALGDPGFAKSVEPSRTTVELFDDGKREHADSLAGDGVFSATLGKINVPGLMAADISLNGQSARSRDFNRRYRVSTVVRHATFDRGDSDISASRSGSREGKWLVALTVKPIDARGNTLGPGYRDRLTIEVPGFTADSPVHDHLDGTYTRTFLIPFGSLGAPAKIAFDQEVIFSGSVRKAFLLGWIRLLLLFLIVLILTVMAVWFWKKRRRHGKIVS